MGEVVVDLETDEGGCIDVVLISGLLRLRLMTVGGCAPLMVRDWWSSISSGDSKMVTPRWESPSDLMHCKSIDSSAVSRFGSIGIPRGNVWLRDRLIWCPEGRRA